MTLAKELEKTLLKKEEIFIDILGLEEVKKQLRSTLLAGRHVLIMGQPGVGKTTLAKNIAKLLPSITVNDCSFNCSTSKPLCPRCKSKKQKTKKIKGIERFVRVQGSPDLTAEDLIGDIDPIKAMKFGPLSIEAFSPGKIFKANNGVLFFDELNRCPEKLQNALLQILEEGKATIGSYDLDFESDFLFIGTMNPKDINTERLSDVLLDRFDVIYMGFPETDKIELEIVLAKGKKFDVQFPNKLLQMIIRFVRELRTAEEVEKVPSVRASLGLYERAQANAFLKAKKNVSFDDVKEAMISVLSHRIELKPSHKYLQSPKEYIDEQFKRFYGTFKESKELKGGCL